MFPLLACGILVLTSAISVGVYTASAQVCSEVDADDQDVKESFEVSLLQTHFSIFESAPGSQAVSRTSYHKTGSISQPQHPAHRPSTKEFAVSHNSEAANRSPDTAVRPLNLSIHESRSHLELMTERVKDMVEEWVGTMNDAMHMGQYHRTTFLIMVICCLALLIVFMLSHQASCRRGRSDRCIHKGSGDQQLEAVQFDVGSAKTMGPAAALKVPLAYNHRPDQCLHEEGLRTYDARKQTFKICDQCGSRWMVQKETCTLVPIAARAAPADPE